MAVRRCAQTTGELHVANQFGGKLSGKAVSKLGAGRLIGGPRYCPAELLDPAAVQSPSKFPSLDAVN